MAQKSTKPRVDNSALGKRLSMFSDTPGSVKSLRKYSKERILDLNAAGLQAELMGESDRASVILLSSLLEEALTFRISKCLCFEPNDEEYDKIFRFEGPLGTFSARMEIACVFGYIDDRSYNQLNMVREMRNACAHSKQALTFSNQTLVNVVKRMFAPVGILPEPVGDHAPSIKALFVLEGILLFFTLYQPP
jgi:hypothetical protein